MSRPGSLGVRGVALWLVLVATQCFSESQPGPYKKGEDDSTGAHLTPVTARGFGVMYPRRFPEGCVWLDLAGGYGRTPSPSEPHQGFGVMYPRSFSEGGVWPDLSGGYGRTPSPTWGWVYPNRN